MYSNIQMFLVAKKHLPIQLSGPGSVVIIATGCRLDGPGIESRCGEIFRTCPDRPWGPSSLLYKGDRVFPGGKERQGRDANRSPPSSAVGHERVEQYIYSPYGPYGLYRASVPVQGVHLTLLTNYLQILLSTNLMKISGPKIIYQYIRVAKYI
jgi:hypothetical protein